MRNVRYLSVCLLYLAAIFALTACDRGSDGGTQISRQIEKAGQAERKR